MAGVSHSWPAHGLPGGPPRLDFGGATPAPAPGYVRVGTGTYTVARGYGWVTAAGLAIRDRGGATPRAVTSCSAPRRTCSGSGV